MPRVTHFEISANEPEKVAEFYSKVFNWEIAKWDGPVDYWLVMTGDPETPGIDGGIMQSKEPMAATVNTIGVEDIDAFAKKVNDNGGEVVGEKMTIPGVGYQIYCKDVQGTTFGLHQSDHSAGQ